MTLSAHLRRARAEFKAWDTQRERLLALGRELVRGAGRIIQSWHRGDDTPAAWTALDAQATRLLRLVDDAPWFRHAGFVQQAFGEYAEATLLRDPAARSRLLRQIPPDALVLGIADTIGELRRHVLDLLLRGDTRAAQRAFDRMENLFEALTDVEAPEPLVPVRTKRDQSRGILERTRGDLVTTKKSKELEKKIDRLGDLLDEAEGRGKPKPKKKSPDDLDLDSAWSKS